MKTVFRNFLTTLRRFKTASVLNILGLSVGFTAFIIVFMQVRYEESFDKSHSKLGRIYRVEISSDSVSYRSVMSHPMVDILRRDIPEIELGALYQGSYENSYLMVERNQIKQVFEEPRATVTSDFLEIFDFEMVEGTKEAFQEPGSVFIPESKARKFFGDDPAVGKQITWMADSTVVHVAGVFRDIPENTHIPNSVYTYKNIEVPDSYNYQMGWLFFTYYVALPEGADRAAVEQKMNAIAQKQNERGFRGQANDIRLNPVEELYYTADVAYDSVPKGSRAMNRMLPAIAFLILLIAGINYLNFSIALTPARIKSINTRKILGDTDRSLRWSLIIEAMGVVLIAYLLSLLWVYGLARTSFNNLMSLPLTELSHWSVFVRSLLIALVVGFLAGVYPAFYSTSFPPALVLKGSFGLSPQGKKLRTVLVGFQFVVSIGLIIAASFMQLQNRFVIDMDKGVNTDRLLTVRLPESMHPKAELLRNLLQDSPEVEEVAFLAMDFGLSDRVGTMGNEDDQGKPCHYDFLVGSWNLPQLLGLELTEGTLFTEADQPEHRKMIFNEAARNQFDWKVGTKVGGGTVVGFFKNVNYKSLRTGINPMGIFLDTSFPKMMYVRYKKDRNAAVEHIRNSIAQADPTYSLDIRSYDEQEQSAYRKEWKVTSLITLFSLLAVIISLMGVFGLVVFETEYRRKEIGVRKVMGATVREILAMLNRKFTIIVAVCFVIAVPLAWYGVKEWLGTFVYKTPLYWWVFALSLVVVMLMTMTTVTVQSLRAATANPVDSLKAE